MLYKGLRREKYKLKIKEDAAVERYKAQRLVRCRIQTRHSFDSSTNTKKITRNKHTNKKLI